MRDIKFRWPEEDEVRVERAQSRRDNTGNTGLPVAAILLGEKFS